MADYGDAQGGPADALNQQRQIDNITDSDRDLEIAFEVNEWKSIQAAHARDIVHHFAAAGGMADVNSVL